MITATTSTQWYRSGYVWLVLSPLIITILGMLATVIIMSSSGALQQHADVGQPLGKVYTGSQTVIADKIKPAAETIDDD